MARLLLAALLPALLYANSPVASAQTVELEQRVAFILKPKRPGFSAPPRVVGQIGQRAETLNEAPMDEREHALALRVQRQTRRFSGGGQNPVRRSRYGEVTWGTDYNFQPRSRNSILSVEDRFPLSDQLGVALGWRGVKVSNRHANITIGSGNDRLSARDWFLPDATLTYRPSAKMAVSANYQEGMRAYGDTGFTGPLGLSQPDFGTFRQSIRPEKSRKMHVDASWTSDGITASIRGYRAHVRNRLSFADRAYLPVNVGSAALIGAAFTVRYQVTANMSWSASYDHAAVETASGQSVREHQAALVANWTRGHWRGAVTAVRSSAPALAGVAAGKAAPWRVEAGIEYILDASVRPLRLAARITNPSRLASVRLMEDGAMGGVRAVDQARAIMFGANMAW